MNAVLILFDQMYNKFKRNIIKFFDDRSIEYDKKFVEPIFWKIFNEKYFLIWISNLTNKKLVLDLGCGTGRVIPILLSKNIKIVGVDISKKMLNIAKSKTRKSNVKFILADLEQLPFKNNISDAVVCYGVLQYLQNPFKAIKEISRILKQSGLYFGLETHRSPIRTIYKKLFFLQEWADTEYHNAFSQRQLFVWFDIANMKCSIRETTFLPPKFFDLCFRLNKKLCLFLFKITEDLLSHIPPINEIAGGLVINGVKR